MKTSRSYYHGEDGNSGCGFDGAKWAGDHHEILHFGADDTAVPGQGVATPPQVQPKMRTRIANWLKHLMMLKG